MSAEPREPDWLVPRAELPPAETPGVSLVPDEEAGTVTLFDERALDDGELTVWLTTDTPVELEAMR